MKSKYSDLEKLKNEISKRNLLSKYHIDKIGVFGSIVRGDTGNDIDIFIENYYDYIKLDEFRTEIEKYMDKKVDIVIDKFVNPIVLYRAKKEMIYVK